MAVIDVKGADWYRVILQDGTTGYISSKLIVPPEIVDAIHNSEPRSVRRETKSDGIEARVLHNTKIWEGPSASAGPMGTLLPGNLLIATGKVEGRSDWYRVKLQDGMTGYVFGKLITLEGVSWLFEDDATTNESATPLKETDTPKQFGLGATNGPLIVSAGALAVSLLGFLSTTAMAWRGDRRAMLAEARSQRLTEN